MLIKINLRNIKQLYFIIYSFNKKIRIEVFFNYN